MLELATIGGAVDLGPDAVTESITPGKRAAVVLIRTDTLNTAPSSDPVSTVVRSAQPSDVDTVIVDGRILKRNGELVRTNVCELAQAASASLAAVRGRVER